MASLAAVLSLNTADAGTVGAVAPQLESALGVGNTRIGLLLTASSLVGAAFAVPVGVLADRVARMPVLAGSVVLWSMATAASGLAASYTMLLASRVALGAVTATAGPTVASLVGDLFPEVERGRVYGWLILGELVGSGIGLTIGSALAGLWTWRAAFWLLAVVGVVLAWLLYRRLPEPVRGGAGRLAPASAGGRADRDARGGSVPEAREEAEAQGVEPVADRVLRGDPARMSLWSATRYVLRVPTAVLLIVASTLGYYFLAGVRVFSLLFVERRYGIPQTEVSLLVPLLGAGAVAGALAGGRIADRLLGSGHLHGRVTVPAVAFAVAPALFLPALLTRSLLVALPLFVLAAAALAAANPPLDAARLDIMHSRLWGRAESVRTVLRTVAEAGAPLLFGVVSELLAGTAGGEPGSGGGTANAAGLDLTFLLMLLPLLGNALLLLPARHTYPRDVATARASERATAAPRP